jgi:hypothetical protein
MVGANRSTELVALIICREHAESQKSLSFIVETGAYDGNHVFKDSRNLESEGLEAKARGRTSRA